MFLVYEVDRRETLILPEYQCRVRSSSMYYYFPCLLLYLRNRQCERFNFSCKNGILASAELENYESPDSEDSNSLGPPAKRLAGVVLSDCIAEEGQEDDVSMDNVPSFIPPSGKKDDSKK